VSNSAVIRYSQLFDIDKSIQVFCNRGTSGIDGSTSTAIGAATISKKNTVFITGDLSFFYDSNALWNNYIPATFRIILVNNEGGGIFRFIPGPLQSNALDYFETPHNLTAEHLCKMYNFEYVVVENEKDLKLALVSFYNKSKLPKLLEIKTPRATNDQVLKAYFNNLK
jgi:2-succinyl-5-enolpyruvyl-6-hydroxy-3-cyclohexene-1-carboxylate synthase